MILEWITGTMIGAVTTATIINKRLKETKEKEKRILKLAKDIHEEFINYAEGRKVNEIDIRDLPRNIQTDMMEHKSLLSKIFMIGDKQGHIPPYLLLLRNDLTGVIKHRVKEGELLIKGKDKARTLKRLEISLQKAHTIKFPNGKKYPVIVAHEDEAEAYPHQPKHHSGALYRIVLALQLAKAGMIPKKKIPKGIIIIGLLLIVGIIGGLVWFFNSGDATTTNTIVQETTNIINNTINMTINGTNIPADQYKQVIV